MPVQAGFAEYCTELLSSAGEVRGKRMFGGYGLYIDDLFVAIIAEDTLYLKADEQTQAQFVEAGGSRFEYEANGKKQSMGYWTVPPDAMDSAGRMEPWARLAMDAARRAKTPRKRRR